MGLGSAMQYVSINKDARLRSATVNDTMQFIDSDGVDYFIPCESIKFIEFNAKIDRYNVMLTSGEMKRDLVPNVSV